MVIIHGIKNCDTIKKALKWFEERGIEYHYHDFRKDGLERQLLERWIAKIGAEALLNKRGTTWRKLPESEKKNLAGEDVANLLLAYPAMIKRPVFDFGEGCRVGFSKQDQVEITHMFL